MTLRRPQIRGGEHTLLYGLEGQERKLSAYPKLAKVRASSQALLDGELAARVVIVRPSGLVDIPGYR